MKVVVISLIFTLCVATVLGCYSQDDCDAGYCCTGGITPWLKGLCRKNAEEGERCDPSEPNTGKYFMVCPCVEGLKCAYKDEEKPTAGGAHCVQA